MTSVPHRNEAAHNSAQNNDFVGFAPPKSETLHQSSSVGRSFSTRVSRDLNRATALAERHEKNSFVILTRDNNLPDPFGSSSTTAGLIPWQAVRAKYCTRYQQIVTVQAVQKRYKKDEAWFAAHPGYPTQIVYTGKSIGTSDGAYQMARGKKKQTITRKWKDGQPVVEPDDGPQEDNDVVAPSHVPNPTQITDQPEMNQEGKKLTAKGKRKRKTESKGTTWKLTNVGDGPEEDIDFGDVPEGQEEQAPESEDETGDLDDTPPNARRRKTDANAQNDGEEQQHAEQEGDNQKGKGKRKLRRKRKGKNIDLTELSREEILDMRGFSQDQIEIVINHIDTFKAENDQAPHILQSDYQDHFWEYLDNEMGGTMRDKRIRFCRDLVTLQQVFKIDMDWERHKLRSKGREMKRPIEKEEGETDPWIMLTATQVPRKHRGSVRVPTSLIEDTSDFVNCYLQHNLSLEIQFAGVRKSVIETYVALLLIPPRDPILDGEDQYNLTPPSELNLSLKKAIEVYCLAAELEDSHVKDQIKKHWEYQVADSTELDTDEKYFNMLWHRTRPGDWARCFWSMVLYRCGYAWWIIEQADKESPFHSQLVGRLKSTLELFMNLTEEDYHHHLANNSPNFCVHEPKTKKSKAFIEDGTIWNGICRRCRLKLFFYDERESGTHFDLPATFPNNESARWKDWSD